MNFQEYTMEQLLIFALIMASFLLIGFLFNSKPLIEREEKIEKPKSNEKSFSLDSVLKVVYESNKLKAEESHTKLYIHKSLPRDLWINGDEVKTFQLLMNLVKNSLIYSSNGSVLLDVKAEEKAGLIEVHFKLKDSSRGLSKDGAGFTYAKMMLKILNKELDINEESLSFTLQFTQSSPLNEDAFRSLEVYGFKNHI